MVFFCYYSKQLYIFIYLPNKISILSFKFCIFKSTTLSVIYTANTTVCKLLVGFIINVSNMLFVVCVSCRKAIYGAILQAGRQNTLYIQLWSFMSKYWRNRYYKVDATATRLTNYAKKTRNKRITIFGSRSDLFMSVLYGNIERQMESFSKHNKE